MLIVKKMTGVVLLALAMTAVPLAAARADQSERTAVQAEPGREPPGAGSRSGEAGNFRCPAEP